MKQQLSHITACMQAIKPSEYLELHLLLLKCSQLRSQVRLLAQVSAHQSDKDFLYVRLHMCDAAQLVHALIVLGDQVLLCQTCTARHLVIISATTSTTSIMVLNTHIYIERAMFIPAVHHCCGNSQQVDVFDARM